MGRGAFDFVLKLGIALPDRSSIFGIGVPKFRTIDIRKSKKGPLIGKNRPKKGPLTRPAAR